MRLSATDLNKISLHCHATAVHLFPMFLNPNYRGAKFEWSMFPDILSTHCETQAMMNCTNERKREAYMEHGRKTGLQIGSQMLKDMTR